MSCEGVSKEQVNNAMRNHGLIFAKNKNLSQQEINDQLLAIHNAHSKVDEKYYLFGDISVQYRRSEVAKRQKGLKLGSLTPDNEKGRVAGVEIHDIMADLINFYHNKKGSMAAIEKKAFEGTFPMPKIGFQALQNLAQELITQIEDIQKGIDPKGKVIIHPELFVLDPIKNIGGTIDLFALFSDGTGAQYDYKTRAAYNKEEGYVKTGYREDGSFGIISDLITYDTVSSYEIAMEGYADALTNPNNVKVVRQNRLVPIYIEFNKIPLEKQTEGNTFGSRLVKVEASETMSQFLSQLPVGERTRFEGLNKLITNQISQLSKLHRALDEKKVDKEDIPAVQQRIRVLQAAIKNMTLREDMNTTLDDITKLLEEIQIALRQQENNTDGTKNQHYPSYGEMLKYLEWLSVYKDISDQTQSYFAELKKTNPEAFKKLDEKFIRLNDRLGKFSYEVSARVQNMIMKEIKTSMYNPDGSLKTLEELKWIDSRTLHFSEIDNPIFKEAWKLIQSFQYDKKKEFETITKDIWSISEELFKWASANGMDRMSAFRKIINPDNGNLHAKLTKEFRTTLFELFNDPTKISYLKSKEIYQIKDQKKYKEEYETLLEEKKKQLKAKHNNLEDLFYGDQLDTASSVFTSRYNIELQKWKEKNDLSLNSAWTNKYAIRRWTEIKPELYEKNLSEEYKYIKANKPLSDYYDMWLKYMEEFTTKLGMTPYEDIRPEFIPNIRKEIVEHFAKDGLHLGAAINEFMDSFNTREDDSYLTEIDETTGDPVKKIRIMYLNPFRDKDGNIDLERKSYDLTTSLLMFGAMALNYEHVSKIEPKIRAIKMLLANPISEYSGLAVTDQRGIPVKGKVQKYLTKAGLNTDTYRLLEDFTDLYLYGIKFKVKSMSKNYNTTKALVKLKNYHGLVRLGFAIIPASGAYIAGKTGIYFESKKRISYTEEQWRQAQYELVVHPNKYQSAIMFFDPYNDDAYERTFRGKSATAKRKLFSERAAFWPLRKADIKIMDHITMAMMHNFGVDKDGNLGRLNRDSLDASLYTPLIDAYKVDEVTGEVSMNITKEAYISFRNAVKKTAGGIIGNMNPEDVSATDVSLTQNIMMQFKTWMPGVVRERTGKLRFDDDLQAMRWGRFAALADQFKRYDLTEEDVKFTAQLYKFSTKVLLPEMGKLIADLTTFGLLNKYGIFGYERVNKERALLKYQAWIGENPDMIGKTTFEDFLEIKEGQMRAVLVELRVIFGFLGLIIFLGGSGDDDEPRYMSNFMTRNLYKILTKAESELAFMWTPGELLKLISNPVPMASMLTVTGKSIRNFTDEMRDWANGENSSQDKSPMGYYFMQWVPGGSQLGRFFEFFDEYRKSPYTPVIAQ